MRSIGPYTYHIIVFLVGGILGLSLFGPNALFAQAINLGADVDAGEVFVHDGHG